MLKCNGYRMRRGKMGSQLGADQKYYISRCEEKQSIQLTITVVGDDEKHITERRDLIDDVNKLLDNIMEVFMPATKERPSLLIPCKFCSVLHITLEKASSGETIYCPNINPRDEPLPCGYYKDLSPGRLTDVIIGKSNESYRFLIAHIKHILITGVKKKLDVFIAYFTKLTYLDFKALYPALISARILNHADNSSVLQATEPSSAALHVLGKISASLHMMCLIHFYQF